jgi:hypothetical protein
VLPRIAVTPSTLEPHAPPVEQLEVERVDLPPPVVEEEAPIPMRAAKPSRARRLKTVVGVVAGSLAGFVVCLLALVALAPPVHRVAAPAVVPSPATSGDLRPRVATGARTPRPVPVPATEAAPAPAPALDSSTARITLNGVPEGAVIRLDGTPVTGTEIAVPADGRERVVRVDLAGYDQWRQTFRARGSATFDVRLTPSAGPAKRRTSPPRSRGAPALIRDPGF